MHPVPFIVESSTACACVCSTCLLVSSCLFLHYIYFTFHQRNPQEAPNCNPLIKVGKIYKEVQLENSIILHYASVVCTDLVAIVVSKQSSPEWPLTVVPKKLAVMLTLAEKGWS